MIIADRSLKVHQGQTDASVTVRVFVPECDNGTWTTRYEIDWPEGKRNGAARGIDSSSIAAACAHDDRFGALHKRLPQIGGLDVE